MLKQVSRNDWRDNRGSCGPSGRLSRARVTRLANRAWVPIIINPLWNPHINITSSPLRWEGKVKQNSRHALRDVLGLHAMQLLSRNNSLYFVQGKSFSSAVLILVVRWGWVTDLVSSLWLARPHARSYKEFLSRTKSVYCGQGGHSFQTHWEGVYLTPHIQVLLS